MLTLLSQDLSLLRDLANEVAEEFPDAERILIEGFARFGSELGVSGYLTRAEYFCENYYRLLNNYQFVDKTFIDFVEKLHGRGLVLRIVAGLYIPDSEIEDVTQEVLEKIWKSHWVEKYNPVISSWKHFIYCPVRNYVFSYKEKKKSRKRLKTESLTFKEWECLLAQVEPPDVTSLIEALLEEWEDFLRVQSPLKRWSDGFSSSGQDHELPPFRRLCTLLPPGSIHLPTQQELTLYFIRRGAWYSKVTLPHLYVSGIFFSVPNDLLVDYISVNKKTGEQLKRWDGSLVTQKYYTNPLYVQQISDEAVRTYSFWDLYNAVRYGCSYEDISQDLYLSPRSVPFWLKKLEELFRSFWLLTDKVPPELKYLALTAYFCPVCQRVNYQSQECEGCGESLVDVKGQIMMEDYPWRRVHSRNGVMSSVGLGTM